MDAGGAFMADQPISDKLEQVATDPRSVSADGFQVQNQDPSKLIEADRYQRTVGVQRRPGLGLLRLNVRSGPPGGPEARR